MYTTLCIAGCYQNCHYDCGLPYNNEDDKLKFKGCCAFSGNGEVCNQCQHSYLTHYHAKKKWELVETSQSKEKRANRQNEKNDRF